MSIARRVYQKERIVPVAFERSHNTESNDHQKPDPDDRGFTNEHGPTVGVCRRDTVRIAVVRKQLDATAPLYATSDDTSKVEIAEGSQQLPEGQRVDIIFTVGRSEGSTNICIRAQAADGPVVARLTVQVSSVINVRCVVHRTAIFASGGSRAAANTTARTATDIDTLFAWVNKIWRPCGINFTISRRRDDTNLTNQVPRNGINPSAGILLCPVYGSTEADGTPVSNENFRLLMECNKVRNRINCYFVRGIQAATATNPPNYGGFGSAHYKGLVVADSTSSIENQAHMLAHELGHIINLAGKRTGSTPGLRNAAHSDDDPEWNSSPHQRRHDLWSRRRLMYYSAGLAADVRTNATNGRYSFDGMDVGHGNGNSGHMLTIKNLVNDNTDNEYTDARRAAPRLFRA